MQIITSDIELDEMTLKVKQLIDKGDDLTEDEIEQLLELSLVISDYEDIHYPMLSDKEI